MVAPLVDQELLKRIREVSDIVAMDEKPSKSARATLVHWVTTITIWMDRAKKTDARVKWLVDLVDRLNPWNSDE